MQPSTPLVSHGQVSCFHFSLIFNNFWSSNWNLKNVDEDEEFKVREVELESEEDESEEDESEEDETEEDESEEDEFSELDKTFTEKAGTSKKLNFFSSKNILYFTEEDLKKLPASSSGSKKVEKKARKIKVDQKLKLPDINEREAGSRAPRVFSPISFVRNTQGLFEKHQVFKSHQNIFIIQQKSLDLKCKWKSEWFDDELQVS